MTSYPPPDELEEMAAVRVVPVSPLRLLTSLPEPRQAVENG